MIENLIKWAEAGDGDAMYKLSTIYRDGEKMEADKSKSEYWLEKAAETKHIDAMKDLAYHYRNGTVRMEQNYKKAIELYKEVAEMYKDVEAMEEVVNMCQLGQGTAKNDEETLDFVLGIINKQFNEIYFINSGRILLRIIEFGTRRHNECTMRYLKAIERRRIANRIRRIKSAN